MWYKRGVRPKEMNRTFTDYVRSLDPSGEPPGAESFERLLGALRRVLRSELANRGLWDSSPGYLGIFGSRRWQDDPDALGELAAECYGFVFVHRLRNLLVHLGDKPSIDGLVFLAVRNFLHEKQKKHDPLGFRVFEVAHAAVGGAVEDGELHVLAGDPRIRNDTVLGFDASTDPGTLAAVRLDEHAGRWNDVLLPDLVTARGNARERTVAVLRSFLARLPASGVDGFRFKELVDPLKNDARGRWAAHLELDSGDTAVEGGEELAEVVRLIPPDSGFEERQSFEKLVDCVGEGLEALDEPARLKDYLAALWAFLRHGAAEHGGELPSRRRIAEVLGIPRNRMSELFGILEGLLRSCRGATFAESAVIPGGGTKTDGGTAMNGHSDSLDALRRQTAETRQRYAAAETELRERSREAPRPGDLFLLDACGELPVEWAAVEVHPEEPRRLWVVPADANSLAGGADVAVPADAPCGPLTLRCAFGLWVDARQCNPMRRTGTLPAESLERARRRRRDLAEGSAGPTEADADSEYRAWIAEMVEPARKAVGEGRVLEFRKPPKTWRESPWVLAASVLLALGVGFGGGAAWRRMSEPRPDVPFLSLFPSEPSRGEEQILKVPAGSEVFLILSVVDVEPHERYGIEIVRQWLGETVWRGELKRTKTMLTFTLPARWPEGTYELRLQAPAGGAAEPLATYEVRIEYDGADVRNGE